MKRNNYQITQIEYLKNKFKYIKSREGKILIIIIIFFVIEVSIFSYVEKLNIIDSIYFTIVTLGTVGYGDIHPTSYLGKVFASLFIVVNIIILAFFIGQIGERLIKQKIEEVLGIERMEEIEDHIIICGYGRIGKVIVSELKEMGSKFVIVEINEALTKIISETTDYNVILGDAKKEDILKKAGIEKAKTIIISLNEDSDNVFTAITAKSMNDKIRIISTAANLENMDKLYKIGVNQVVSPQVVTGKILAHSVNMPDFLTLIDRIFLSNTENICMVALKEDLYGKTVKDVGDEVFAIVRNEKIIKNPNTEDTLQKGDKLIIVH
ncbi:MAG: Calcium-gated potassium channel MthK [Candidatus Methanofastidiosum methylothiophilum]|uniref:Calcium-gated potassium channel MthK n=1 Tax=Candidatus Methanofastidiosum methylothiophilum TaxID=1705564 RepID=A0A150IZB6_9EURY|nr:MAG: Calcium-gated potassium channel MthK [Candidatus Methanofastidiosum methylthiophilus]KYC47591.1 MAG: Calcium-gated potassium channel MthK [Candidatus Methanofastidiosum methylthiophilus]KYC50208.1 MAG: Calcium-gated potassium channel MthK [Candidatus Methanofastidiosum methylthiophilus]